MIRATAAAVLILSACPGPGPNVDPPFDCEYREGMTVVELDACYGLVCRIEARGGGNTARTYCPAQDTCSETCSRRMTVGVNSDGVSTWVARCPEQGCQPPTP